MNILVTGGAGYIGSHTAKILYQSGHFPVVFDNLSTGHEWAVKWGPLVRADLSDISAIRQALGQYQIAAVIHFAASAYVGESMADPFKYFQNNVMNSLNLLQAMKDVGVKRIVFSSSCAIYGLPTNLPIDESHPTDPINPYGESKLMVEKMLRWYGDIHGFRWIALRYFNAAGADPEGETGELHEPETHLIPLAVNAALNPDKTLAVFGTDYPTADGSAVRDYIHVMDLANAHLRAIECLENIDNQVLNLGTGKGVSVFEIVDAVSEISGKKINTVLQNKRAGDPPVLIADPARAREVLGWKAQYTDISFAIKTGIEWAQKLLAEEKGG